MRVKYRPTPSKEYMDRFYSYDPETGIFTRASDRKRWKAGQVCGTSADGYISINVDRVVYRAHRLAWRMMTGDDPDFEIDHVNTVRSDNRWSNLRRATHSENVANAPLRKTNTSGYKGVKYDKRRNVFYAGIQFQNKAMYLGRYATAHEASIAYESAAKIIHGEFCYRGSDQEQPDRSPGDSAPSRQSCDYGQRTESP